MPMTTRLRLPALLAVKKIIDILAKSDGSVRFQKHNRRLLLSWETPPSFPTVKKKTGRSVHP